MLTHCVRGPEQCIAAPPPGPCATGAGAATTYRAVTRWRRRPSELRRGETAARQEGEEVLNSSAGFNNDAINPSANKVSSLFLQAQARGRYPRFNGNFPDCVQRSQQHLELITSCLSWP